VTHELEFTSHTHDAIGKHTVWGRCSCGEKTYEAIAQSASRARNNIQHKHRNHVGEKKDEREHLEDNQGIHQ
jgi:hypothetical protein